MGVDPEKVVAMAAAYSAARNSRSTEAVVSFFAPEGRIVINRGQPWVDRKDIQEMAAGFYADVPDLTLVCDDVRCADDHVAYFWTITGTHGGTKKPVRVVGWEEWDLDTELKIVTSRGWYDAADYARQTTSD